jgi:FkbM family methyltransferase
MQNKSFRVKLLRKLFKKFKIDPMLFAYNQIGILNWQNDDLSGENNFVHNILPKETKSSIKPILFDVGANIGRYSENLLKQMPNAEVHSFEPLPSCKAKLEELQKIYPRRSFVTQSCVSNEPGSFSITTYANNLESEHASVYSEVLKTIHKSVETKTIDVPAITIDQYCEQNNINKIDLLKIDTEGHEYSVLLGAKRMLSEGKIALIQFEFNEMNVISRTFFKDFYDLLSPTYKIYRLNGDRLIEISQYDSILEVFKFQNFIAILNS